MEGYFGLGFGQANLVVGTIKLRIVEADTTFGRINLDFGMARLKRQVLGQALGYLVYESIGHTTASPISG
jgi:hypothetical protein